VEISLFWTVSLVMYLLLFSDVIIVAFLFEVVLDLSENILVPLQNYTAS
jgi:hypothetical protein